MSVLPATVVNFYVYQKKRFPFVILGLSLLPAILSSGAIVANPVSWRFGITALLVSLAYLLHARIIDEHRDFKHDLIHHPDRPLSTGAITMRELEYIDQLAVGALLLISITISLPAFLFTGIMLFYSFLAKKEFIIGPPFRRYFFTYNTVNLVQMWLLQILVYIIANENLTVTPLLLWHFSFTATGTIIYEFLRKVKTPGNDGTGEDTYTWFLGLRKALLAYGLLAIINIFMFIKIVPLLDNPLNNWSLISALLAILVFVSLTLHSFRQAERTNQLMQLMFMLMYGSFNLIIFWSI